MLAAYLQRNQAELQGDPQLCMRNAFELAHKEIRRAIVEKYKALGEPLTETKEGFLVEEVRGRAGRRGGGERVWKGGAWRGG